MIYYISAEEARLFDNKDGTYTVTLFDVAAVANSYGITETQSVMRISNANRVDKDRINIDRNVPGKYSVNGPKLQPRASLEIDTQISKVKRDMDAASRMLNSKDPVEKSRGAKLVAIHKEKLKKLENERLVHSN
jgi:hypothetical protein